MDNIKGENCFPSTFRLKNPSDFSYLRKKSQRFRYSSFIVYAKTSQYNLNNSRLGVSASKKTGNAVARNTIKRVFREFFRQSALKHTGDDFLIVASRHLKNLSRAEVVDSLRSDLSRFAKDFLNDRH